MRALLIADDDAALRLLVHATLESEEYTIVEATDGDAALAQIRAERPWLAFLDVEMPKKTGLEVCREVKADANLKKTIIVLLTGQNSAADRLAGRVAGADAYLTKPFSPLQVLRLVERTLVR